MAYTITRLVNNEGKKKELFSLLLDQIENSLNFIEKQLATRSNTRTDIQNIIIPQFKAVTTRITAFRNAMPKYCFKTVDPHKKLRASLDDFTNQFTMLRTIISDDPDEFCVRDSSAIRRSDTYLKSCRLTLWKVKFIVFS
jgi:hypothetical protein